MPHYFLSVYVIKPEKHNFLLVVANTKLIPILATGIEFNSYY